MIFKTYNCNSFNIHTIKTDKFKTAHMEIIFRKKAVKEELCSYAFLMDMLSESCELYPKRKNLITRFEELYRSSVYGSTTRSGNILSSIFTLDFINPEYINEDNYLEEVIKLPFEMLLKPNVTNEEFEQKQFKLIKDRLKREIESIKENPTKMCIRKALNLMDSSTPSTYPLLGTLDDLKKITPSSLYKTYRKFFKENTCDIFIIGNLDMDEVAAIIKKHFKHRYINEINEPLLVDNKVANKAKVGSEENETIQANLVMLFNITNLNSKETDITFQVFNYLYGNGGLTSKLYQSLREKNSLCYGVSSMYLKYDGLLLVQLSLENANLKKAISLVKKELRNMQNGEFSEEELTDAKKNMVASLDLAYDNNVAILNNYVFNIFAKFPLIDERKELYQSITKEEVIKVSKKIKLNTIYMLKGKGD